MGWHVCYPADGEVGTGVQAGGAATSETTGKCDTMGCVPIPVLPNYLPEKDSQSMSSAVCQKISGMSHCNRVRRVLTHYK